MPPSRARSQNCDMDAQDGCLIPLGAPAASGNKGTMKTADA